MKYSNKSILAVIMKWDYGIPARGESGDRYVFGKTFEKLLGRVDYFWFDEYFTNNSILQNEIIKVAQSKHYDLIFFLTFKDEFNFSTLDSLRSISPTIAWFGDDQWRFDSFTSLYAAHYTYCCTTDYYSVAKYKSIGINPLLTQWAGFKYSDLIGPLSDEEKYEFDISFIGQNNPYRNWFVSHLKKKNIRIECFGPGWTNGRISFERMEQIMRRSKISLNISNSINYDIRYIISHPRCLKNFLQSPKRVEQPKARNFEINCAGGFQLSNYFIGLEHYYAIGEELAIYNTIDECIQQIEYYLTHEEKRIEIAKKGHARAINEHTYMKRFERIFDQIWG